MHVWVMGLIVVLIAVGGIVQNYVTHHRKQSATGTPAATVASPPSDNRASPQTIVSQLAQQQTSGQKIAQEEKQKQARIDAERKRLAQEAQGGGFTTIPTPSGNVSVPVSSGGSAQSAPARSYMSAGSGNQSIIALSGSGGGMGGGDSEQMPPSDTQQNLPAMTQQLLTAQKQQQTQEAANTALIASALKSSQHQPPASNATAAQQNEVPPNERFLADVGKKGAMSSVIINAPPALPTLMPGSVIPAVLVTQMDSDLPGMTTARVTENVYDSIHGTTLMIPAGSTLVGYYSSNVAAGQTRLLIAYDTIIFPDGSTVNLKGMEAADAYGQAGMTDQVNTHFFKSFGSSFLIAALGSLAPAGPNVTVVNNTPAGGPVMASAAQSALSQTAQGILQKNGHIPPTLIERAGKRFNVMVNRAIQMPPVWERPVSFAPPSASKSSASAADMGGPQGGS